MNYKVRSTIAITLVILGRTADAFTTNALRRRQPWHRTVTKVNKGLFASYDDDDMARLLPETSFGAEVVPEGQRPVNEYLDLVRAPLFGWASEDVGSKGLLARLVTVYAASFAIV
jgi:hypothetical protein